MISESPQPSPECFPLTAQDMLEDGTMKGMSELLSGDRVQVSQNSFSEVFLFINKDPTTVPDFFRFYTAAGCALPLIEVQ